MNCPLCNDTGDQRYWEGRWRDERADNERLETIIRRRTKLLDDQRGTPCEQIRHAEEVARLQAEILRMDYAVHNFDGQKQRQRAINADLLEALITLLDTSLSADLRFHNEFSKARAAKARATGEKE
jgi:hypothetical protein